MMVLDSASEFLKYMRTPSGNPAPKAAK